MLVWEKMFIYLVILSRGNPVMKYYKHNTDRRVKEVVLDTYRTV